MTLNDSLNSTTLTSRNVFVTAVSGSSTQVFSADRSSGLTAASCDEDALGCSAVLALSPPSRRHACLVGSTPSEEEHAREARAREAFSLSGRARREEDVGGEGRQISCQGSLPYEGSSLDTALNFPAVFVPGVTNISFYY